MAANAGPDIVEDGIVFYYDTGNTVKSYVGEPTTNLALDTLQQGGWPGTHTLISSGTKTFDLTTSTVEWGGDASWTMFYYDVTAYTGQHICLSATYEYSSSPGGGNLAFVMIGQTTGSQTYLGYSSPLDYNSVSPTPGQQISWNGVVGDGGKIGILTWMNNGNSTTLTSRFSKVQLEVKTHPTQFVNGTRSVTQGLLDMSRNSTINITNASFTSNAQLTFDGTNDSIEAPFETILNDCSFEVWFKATSTRTYQYPLAIRNNSVGSSYAFYLDMNDPDGSGFAQTMWVYWNSGGTPYSVVPKTGTYGDWNDSTWRHYVFTRSTTNSPYTLHYMNGNLVSSINRAGDQTTQFGNGAGYKLYLGQYGAGFGYFPGELPIIKIYNRVLSASEVLTNYNALKSRFGI
jgi:hypothetical protein